MAATVSAIRAGFRVTAAGIIAAALALIVAPVVLADPAPLPPAPPYIPGDVAPEPGSFSYPYNNILVDSPATVDARGVNVTSIADPSQSAVGLPGSALGNSPPPANSLTNSSALYGIAAGVAPPMVPNPGVNIGAGIQQGALEDPDGHPPTAVPEPESVAPTDVPGNPLPALESPGGAPPSTG